MKPSLETLAGLYAAALEQQERTDRSIKRIRDCITRHDYTFDQVAEEIARERSMPITAGDYAMRPRK